MEIDTWSFMKFSVNHLEWGKILVSGVEGGGGIVRWHGFNTNLPTSDVFRVTEWQKALANRNVLIWRYPF